MKTPLQVVELRQPRCSLRFGVGVCPATGAPKCYNTWATCPASARSVFANTGSIHWRFVKNSPGMRPFGTFATNAIATNGIPVSGLSVSTSKSQLNISGILSGKSPFGIRGTVSISMEDFQWSDPVGDFYLADRTNMVPRTFWQTFIARNALFANMEIVIYDGYEGDTLAAMRQRLYILDSISGPAGGKVTLNGIDPLMLADRKRAMFPPAYTMSLFAPITNADTTLDIITNAESNVSGAVGISTNRYILIGSEIIGYTGYSVVTAGQYRLTGLLRGQGGSVAAAATTGAKIGRVGYFANQLMVDVAEYLFLNWTTIGASRIDSVNWHDERDTYLPVGTCTTFVTSPTSVVDLMGELCQQGTFNIWWDEYDQIVKLRAIRAPDVTVPSISDATTVLADSAVLTMEPDARLTRILVFYDPIDATKTAAENYRIVSGEIEADGELPQAGGEARTLIILARWVQSEAQAYQIISRTFLRYRSIPQMLTIKVSAKDREISIGDVLDITTRIVKDTEGKSKVKRWQVVSWSEIVAGQTYQLDMQDFALTGRFATIMAAGADYTASSAAEKAAGGFIADAAGLMSDSSDGYHIG